MPNFLLKTTLSSGLSLISLLLVSNPLFAADLNRARQLADIAFGYGLANHPDKAIPLLEEAETYAGDDCYGANVWLKIGAGYQMIQQLDKAESFLIQAVEIAQERTKENCALSATSPDESLLNRATDYAQAGHLDLALNIASRIDNVFQPITIARIAGEYYKTDQQRAKQIVTEAVAIAQENNTVPMVYQTISLIAMVDQFNQAEQPTLAQLVIEESDVTQPFDPADAMETGLYNFQMLRLAGLLVDLDQPQQAQDILDSLVPTIQPSSEFPLDVIQSWIEVALLYERLDGDQAEPIWQQIRTSLQQVDDGLGAAQQSLARGYAELGDFDQATALADSIEAPNDRQAAYSAIAIAYARAGQAEAANRLVESMRNPEHVQHDMVRAYLDTEQYAQAEQLAQQLVQQPDTSAPLSAVGRTYCDVGLPERVVPLIDLIASADGLRECAAIAFAEQGQFEQALELTKTITEPEYRSKTLVAIAAQCTTANVSWHRLIGWLPKSLKTWLGVCDAQKAVELLDQALDLI